MKNKIKLGQKSWVVFSVISFYPLIEHVRREPPWEEIERGVVSLLCFSFFIMINMMPKHWQGKQRHWETRNVHKLCLSLFGLSVFTRFLSHFYSKYGQEDIQTKGQMDGRTDRRTDRTIGQTDKQTDRPMGQIDWQTTDRQTGRLAGRQTERHKDS